MIRVLLADDDTIVRGYLATLLGANPELMVVGTASNGIEAVRLATELRPDVVVLDLNMPGLDGIEASRQIRRMLPSARIAILTGQSDKDAVLKGITSGADTYLLKSGSGSELASAILSLAKGQAQLSGEPLNEVLSEMRRLRGESREIPPPSVSERERAVLRSVARGLSNKEIASDLGIEISTVKSHLHKAFEKLGVQDRTQAAILIEKNGWFRE